MDLLTGKKLGFGCMRLPMADGTVDYDEFTKMVKHLWRTDFIRHGIRLSGGKKRGCAAGMFHKALSA